MQWIRHVHPQHGRDGGLRCCTLDHRLGGVRVAQGGCGHRLELFSWHQQMVFHGLIYNPIQYRVLG